VPGLRKEELALLAGISPDHYSRLEQGRQHTVTDDIVEALSRALQLDEIEQVHLRDLAAPQRRQATAWESPQRPDPGLLRMMTALDQVPALVLGRRSEILACNGLLRAVLGAEVEAGASLVRWLFLDPRSRQRIENWSDYAASAVGAIRYEVGRHPRDPRIRELVDELRAATGTSPSGGTTTESPTAPRSTSASPTPWWAGWSSASRHWCPRTTPSSAWSSTRWSPAR
jgi:PAS domain-containing protein